MNPEISAGSERRRHKRYRVKDETFAFFGEDTGTLVDISKGGLAIHCAVFEKEPIPSSHLDIFIAHPHFYLPGIPFSLISTVQTVPVSIFSLLKIKRFSMQFGPLTDVQLARIENFIASNTISDN
jgi:hypothetical protein